VTTDNDVKVVARLPFCVAGPRRLLTQSEVATMDFLRRRCTLPIVPRVLAWSSEDNNPVGSEYIIMEYTEGVSGAERFLDPTWWSHSSIESTTLLL
jgi:hypothetical protein